MDELSSVLSTPIKKIRNLSLNSPTSPIRYPSMNDFPLKKDPLCLSMVDKGYSQTLSNKVLRELDNRANEISSRIAGGTVTAKLAAASKKRYLGIHRPLFLKMDSILAHYAASRPGNTQLSPTRAYASSATKKRRTLNGPEEIFAFNKENESPVRRKGQPDADDFMQTDPVLDLSGSLPLNGIPSLSAPSTRLPLLHSSPMRPDTRDSTREPLSREPLSREPLSREPFARQTTGEVPREPLSRMELPTRIPQLGSLPLRRISPLKGSMNLHKLLHEPEFAKPLPKTRPTSLQMAGVTEPALQKKPSVPSLQKKSSIPQLQKKPSIPALQKKPSIPTLQKKPVQRPPSLQKKPSTQNMQSPALQKKPSIPSFSGPSLQKKPSVPTFQSGFQMPAAPASHTLHKKPSLLSLASRPPVSTLHKKPSNTSLRPNVTIPQPFSLYNKPTVASSQKSLAAASMQSSASQKSLSSQASTRSLNRFQKFKSRFS